MNKAVARLLVLPSTASLLIWSIVPLCMTLYFSGVRYDLTSVAEHVFCGLENYRYFLTDDAFLPALRNTVVLLVGTLGVTLVLGAALALLLNEPFCGRGIVRVMLISPFFVMSAVNGVLWKNMMMNPISGILAHVWQIFGLRPVDWLGDFPMLSITIMVAWQWLPFACLIFMTALQSMDREQLEAANLDGATYWQQLRYLYLPHLARPMSVIVMIETIFLLSIFAEIQISTNGGPGYESTNLAYLIYTQALQSYDVGTASSGALLAVVLANIVANFLVRIVGKNLDHGAVH